MRNFTEEEYNIIYDTYVNQKRGLLYCSKQVKSSPDTVKKELKKHGIHIRNFSEAATESNLNRASKKNETFFSNPSSDMAWLMGFLASDGSISKKNNEIKIGLSIKDREILEKIKDKLELQTNIKEFTDSKGYDSCKLSWSCKQHKEDLSKYNIVPKKTFILKPPLNLPKEYWMDYIRGYFDGDGSINIIKNSNGRGNGNLRWQIASATKDLLEWIINFLYEEYDIPKVNIQCRPIGATLKTKNNLYYFQYSSAATRKIYNILYTKNSLFLKRKKDKFDEVLSLVTPLK